MIGDFLCVCGYEVDDWYIEVDDFKDLCGFGLIEYDFFKVWIVVGIYCFMKEMGKLLILQGYCDVVLVGLLDFWDMLLFLFVVKDGKLFGCGVCDMKLGMIGVFYVLDVIKVVGLKLIG